jgi:type IV pilus assembly protein PilA
MDRTRSESGFTLIEFACVALIIAVLVAVAVPAFLSMTSSAQTAIGKANVRAAIPAAEKMTATNGNYAGINGAALRAIAPGLPSTVKAVAVNANDGYCVQDTENNGAMFYHYVGGNSGLALRAGYNAATIQPGACFQAVGRFAS